MSSGFSFDEVSNMSISQLKVLSQAISKNQRSVGLNTMNWHRVAMHADSDEFAEITRDFQRD